LRREFRYRREQSL